MLQDGSRQPPERSHDKAGLTILVRKAWSHRGTRASIVGALTLLALDAGLGVSFYCSSVARRSGLDHAAATNSNSEVGCLERRQL
jgi:hypothetical protein